MKGQLRACGLELVLMAAALHLGAQSELATLSVQTASGQNTFHVGERIALRLTFSSPNDTDYLIVPGVSGRGGEFDCNRFEVVGLSDGWSDPLEMYFKQDLIRTGHGWQWPPLTKAKPVVGTVDLNEWIRFDKPGNYTVKITSSCAVRKNAKAREVLTKTFDLTIIAATVEWQNEKFQSIQPSLDLLDQRPPQPEPGVSSQTQWERRTETFTDATADLKYLGTPAAIDEMTLRLRSEKFNLADQCSIGLMGLPPAMRETAFASMNRRIAEPDFPINSWFFSTLSFLNVTPGSDKESIRKQREAANEIIWSAIFASVTRKNAAARAETVQTLLDYGRHISGAAADAKMTSLLRLAFLNLDSRSQIDDLRNRWDRLRSPAFLPTLRTLARLPVQSDSDLDVWTYNRQELKGLAFKRWYELDPKGAHHEIVAEIGSSSPSLAGQTIAFLPEEQFPQFELLWAQALLETKSQLRERALGSLLVRFGTGAVVNQMVAKLEEKSDYPCDAHVLALAYLTRFDPKTARERLKQEFPGKCSSQLLRFIAELTTGAVLNDQAVENLNSTDPDTVRDAVQYLTWYGRREDEDPLLKRYTQWAAAHAGQGDLPDRGANTPAKTFADFMLGEELGRALIRGQGWFASKELIASVLEKCTGDTMCKSLRDVAGWAKAPYSLSIPSLAMASLGVSTGSAGVAQYATRSLKLFDEKIGQFPQGSEFVFDSWYRPSNSDERRLEEDVRSIIKKHGMSVVDSTK